jgi:hypothetical protein
MKTKKDYSLFGLTKDEAKQLIKYCKDNDIKVTRLVRRLIRAHVIYKHSRQ